MIDHKVFLPEILYKHKNNTDVAFDVIGGRLTNSAIQTIKVRWWNITNPENIFYIDTQETVSVPHEKSFDWLEYGKLDDKRSKWEVIL